MIHLVLPFVIATYDPDAGAFTLSVREEAGDLLPPGYANNLAGLLNSFIDHEAVSGSDPDPPMFQVRRVQDHIGGEIINERQPAGEPPEGAVF